MIRTDKNFPLSEIPDYDDIFKDEDDEEEFDEDDGDAEDAEDGEDGD